MKVFNNTDVQGPAQLFQPGIDVKLDAVPTLRSGMPLVVDPVSIGLDAELLAKVKRSLSAASDIRREKVEALKNAIANGTYRVDSSDIADAMLREGILS